MGDTVAQMQAEWAAHGNIARLEFALAAETNPGRRKWLEELLAEQRALVPLAT
jgi:hypothetical protein